jgi:hypothetical protein
MKTSNSTFERFDAALKEVLKVSHAEIKAKLEEEEKRKKSNKPSASREANVQKSRVQGTDGTFSQIF